MKQLFQKTILALWLASLLVSTTGIALHRVYCFCKKEATFSLFFESEAGCHAEKMAEKAAAENLENLPVCCRESEAKKATAEPSCCSKKGHEKSGCTKHEVHFSKLDAKFLKGENETQVLDYQVVAIKIAAPSLPFFASTFESEKTAAASFRGPPPRFAGRELRVFLKSFRC